MIPALFIVGVTMSLTAASGVRPPAVAGAFYSADREELARELQDLLRAAPPQPSAPRAVIAPHAGYVYSGRIAAQAFAGLAGSAVRRVVLLGPSHHASFSGGALPPPTTTAFATPLGDVPVDRDAIETLRGFPEFRGPVSAHAPEHCLEVELPFLQATAGNVAIVPILVGHATDPELAAAMAQRIATLLGDGTIVVVSSDFTHHGGPYGWSPFPRNAELVDRLEALARDTAARAADIDPRGFRQQLEVSSDTVCGGSPISVLLELLDHAFTGSGRVAGVTTSADVSGSTTQVVSYAAVTFTGSWKPWHADAPPPELGSVGEEEKPALTGLARATLESFLRHDGALARWFAHHSVTGNLAAPAGVFVTVNNRGEKARREGRLRGCIGVMEAREPLVDAIVHAAVSAANDPRFPPLAESELAEVALEISVLSPMRRVPDWNAIELGTHGVVLAKSGRRAVFLPQVATETGWDLATFLTQLSRKAGLDGDAWRHGASFEVFTAQVFGEEHPAGR